MKSVSKEISKQFLIFVYKVELIAGQRILHLQKKLAKQANFKDNPPKCFKLENCFK